MRSCVRRPRIFPSGVRRAGLPAPRQAMLDFIDDHRESYGVEPISRVLPIDPSTYYEHKARESGSRIQRDRWLNAEIQHVWDENFGVYGIHKVWRQLHRETIPAARCTVEHLMRQLVLRGVVRGKLVRTTVLDTSYGDFWCTGGDRKGGVSC